MNKVFYITGIVFSVVFMSVCVYYFQLAETAANTEILISTGSYLDYAYSDSTANITTEAGLVSLFFFLFFLAADILGVIKVKTITMKVMGIIGIAITALFLLWDFLMLTSPGALGFNESGIGFIFYCLIALAFSIVGLIQSIRFSRPKQAVPTNRNPDLLDS